MHFHIRFLIAPLLAAAFLAAAPALLWADCSGPSGIKGEIIYNDDYDTLQFCDSTNWISMSASGTAVESDPQVDTLTASRWCKSNAGGTAIECDSVTVPASASGSTGLVQFYASGTLGSDNAFFWDATNHRLGIGTAAPGTAVDVSGTVTATLFSGSGASLTALNASNLGSGTVADARFPATLPALSGENLTGLNAGNLAVGTIPDARFPAALPVVSGANLTDLSATALTSGTIPDARFPAALPAISGVNLTNLNASSLASGTIPDARFPATLPAVSGVNLTALNASNLGSGTVPVARLGTGTAGATNYLRGDQSWSTIGLSGGLSDVSLSSPSASQILTYNGSAWTNAAVGSLVAGVAGPSFHVHRNNVNQAMSGVTKLTWSTEDFDTNNNSASNKFTPTVAGKYVLTATVSFQLAATNYFALYLYKNGAGIKTVSNVLGGSNPGSVTLTAVVDANGTTDYFEVYAYNSVNAAAEGNTGLTYFSGGMLAPLASGVVAGTGAAGYVPYWTSGNALTYDSTAGGQFYWDSTNHRLGLGTSTPSTLLHVNGSTTLGGAVSLGDAITGAAAMIGLGTTSVAVSAVLDMVSTTKGFLPPRMTEAQRDAISSPATGLVVYNTDSNKLNVRGASSWGEVGGGASVDSLDFSDFKDAMALDASTDIGIGTAEAFTLSITNQGSGNSFVVNDQASDTSPFIIDASGNVGIGTDAPVTALHVVGTTTTTVLHVGGQAGGAGEGGGGSSGAEGAVQFSAGTGLASDEENFFWDDGNNRLGIGTATPSTALEVAGTVTATLFAGSGASLTSLNASNLGSGTIPDARFPATLPAVSGVNLTALDASNLGSGTVATARLGSGTANSTTFLRGDNTWATPSSSVSADSLDFSDFKDAESGPSRTVIPADCGQRSGDRGQSLTNVQA
jgi:hypothetical protein